MRLGVCRRRRTGDMGAESSETPFELGRLGTITAWEQREAPSRRAWRNGWRNPGAGGY